MSPDCHTCRLPMVSAMGLVRIWRCLKCNREVIDETRP